MNYQKMERPIDILLVEDSPADARLTMEALSENGVPSNTQVVNDGVEAMAFLKKEGGYENVPRPDLILLDLNLPKKNGIEVLAEIKGDASLKRIPVIILSMSDAQLDITKAYNLHANCYTTKPVDLDQFAKVVKSIEAFWLTIAKLPTNALG